MLDLSEAYKRLSWENLRALWKQYKELPLRDKQVLQTYAVVSVLIVGTLVAILASYRH